MSFGNLVASVVGTAARHSRIERISFRAANKLSLTSETLAGSLASDDSTFMTETNSLVGVMYGFMRIVLLMKELPRVCNVPDAILHQIRGG